MSIAAFLSVLLAFFQAIPKLKEWFDELLSMYINQQIENMKQENRDAIRKAIYEKDQRDLEKALGSQHAGLPSGNPNTVIVDPGSIPNTH